MTKESHLLLTKGTLERLQLKACVTEPVKDFSQVAQVLWEGPPQDDDIIQVDETVLPMKTSQDTVYHAQGLLDGRTMPFCSISCIPSLACS